jgi:uncharacterized protein (DUF1330 family)
MSAYVVIRAAVSDPEAYRRYAAASTAAAATHGGRFLARGGKTLTLEGPEDPRRVVILEFADMAHAQAWYRSPEYQAAKALREGAAVAEFLAVEGV